MMQKEFSTWSGNEQKLNDDLLILIIIKNI